MQATSLQIDVADFLKLYFDNQTRSQMKLLGFVLLLSGWGIVIAALSMLHGKAVPAFILAGVAIEGLGLALVVRAHLPTAEGQE